MLASPSPPPVAAPASATPAPAAAPLPDGTYVYTVSGPKASATATIVVSRKNDLITVAANGDGFIGNQAGKLTSEVTLSQNLHVSIYDHWVQAGFMDHSYISLLFPPDQGQASEHGSGIKYSPKYKLLGTSTGWLALSLSDYPTLFALAAQANACACQLATAANLDENQLHVAALLPGLAVQRPANIAATDVSLAVLIEKLPVVVWYDPHTFVADEIDVASNYKLTLASKP